MSSAPRQIHDLTRAAERPHAVPPPDLAAGVGARRQILCALPMLIALTSLSSEALASKPRLRLERVDASRCASGGLITLYAAELELEGVLRKPSQAQLRLVLDDQAQPGGPGHATSFSATEQKLHLALAIQVSGISADDLARIKTGGEDLIRTIPHARSRFSLIAYDWQARRLVSRGTRQRALDALAGIEAASVAPDPALGEAINLGLRSLPPAAADTRRLMVLLSDGMNNEPKRDAFRMLGTRARTRGVMIHPIAYSAIDERGPLMNLGEIAKRTNGTFRWAKKGPGIKAEFLNLAREINEQMVLTFKIPDRCARGHEVRLQNGELLSNAIKIAGAVGAAGRKQQEQEEKGERISPLVIGAMIGGGLVTMVLLVLLARLLTRGRRTQERGAPLDRPPEKSPRKKKRKKKRSASSRPADSRSDRAALTVAADDPGSSFWLMGASPIVFNLRFQIPPGRAIAGSAPDCALQLEGEGVAPYHFELTMIEGDPVLTVIPPAQVLVNGQAAQQLRLVDGDLLQVGHTQLLVRET